MTHISVFWGWNHHQAEFEICSCWTSVSSCKQVLDSFLVFLPCPSTQTGHPKLATRNVSVFQILRNTSPGMFAEVTKLCETALAPGLKVVSTRNLRLASSVSTLQKLLHQIWHPTCRSTFFIRQEQLCLRTSFHFAVSLAASGEGRCCGRVVDSTCGTVGVYTL